MEIEQGNCRRQCRRSRYSNMPAAPVTDPNIDRPPETVLGLAISLLFWISLISAGFLFAAVTLSPKSLKSLQLRSQFDANQVALVQLEDNSERLKRIIDAIKNDSEFAAEMARTEFDAARPDEEVIPVETPLQMNLRVQSTPTRATNLPHHQYEAIIRWVATDPSLRTTLLSAAGILVVFAFWFLQPPSLTSIANRGSETRSMAAWIAHRYFRKSGT